MGTKKTFPKSFPWSYVFIGAVVVFAAWVYFHEFKGADEREKVKSEAAAVLPFSNADVTRVTIAVRDSLGGPVRELVLKKEGTKEAPEWKVEKPYADRGDAGAIDSFLSTLSTEKSHETVVEAADIAWKTYGLDAPAVDATVIAKGEKGETTRKIQIGSIPAYDGSVYARFDGGNKVDLLSSTAQAVLQKDAREFRDKRFFTSPAHPEFTSLTLARAGFPTLRFALKDGVWRDSGSGGVWPLDQGAITSYIQTVSGLRGSDVWAEDKKDAKVLRARKLDRPGLSISLAGAKGKYEVQIAALAKDETVAGAIGSERPLVFSLYKAQIDLLTKTIDDFLDLKYPFQFKLADVLGFELERPAGEVSLPILLKKDGKWLIDPLDTRFPGRDAKSEAVDRLVADISALHAKKILPKLTPKPKITEKNSLRAGFFAGKNKKIAEFIFTPNGENVRVWSSLTSDRVYEIEKAQFEALSLDVVTAPKEIPKPSTMIPAIPPGEKGKE